jgi:DNA-directed RNA polymerase subunit beta'
LIPAGTGAYMRSIRRVAAERDVALRADREALPAPEPIDLSKAMQEAAGD